jgi:diguanylate cyclase (GGDEF)-like protein
MPSDQQLSGVLREFARTMVTDFPIQSILNGLVERIVDIMPITAAGVTLISPGVDPRYVAASDEAALRFEQLQTELGEGPCLEAYRTGQAVVVPDLREDNRFPAFAPRAVRAGLEAVFAFPLYHGARRLGALDLYRDEAGVLESDTMGSAQILADVTSAYILNAQSRADLQDSSEQSRQASLHDALTGLPNRILLLERIEHAFVRARRSGRTPAVLFVDLDRFKEVNDSYGHRVGDDLLIAVSERLTGLLRAGDTLARMSGDEFVILCEDLAFSADADRIVSRVAAALATPFVLAGLEVDITGSVGVAHAHRADGDPEDLLHRADRAMYRAKRNRGGGQRHIFDLRAESLAELQTGLGRDLAGVLERTELHLDYQPIVDTVDGRVINVEALLRWDHPTRGPVPPTVLIPLAEHSGLINPIGRWVLQQAWADRNRWPVPDRDAGRTAGGADLAVSVNVSAQQLMSPHFAEAVATVLGSAGTDPRLLTLEVTETVFVRDGERALTVLGDLKDMGVMVALDDFGTGYSSLGYLKRFPVDIVKIDQAFVADLENPASHTIVAAVVKLAHDLSISVTAEGVETAEQYRELSLLGCDACQGFYFARPMPASRLDRLIAVRNDGTEPRLPEEAD